MNFTIVGLLAGALIGLALFVAYVRVSDRIEKKRAEKRLSGRPENRK